MPSRTRRLPPLPPPIARVGACAGVFARGRARSHVGACVCAHVPIGDRACAFTSAFPSLGCTCVCFHVGVHVRVSARGCPHKGRPRSSRVCPRGSREWWCLCHARACSYRCAHSCRTGVHVWHGVSAGRLRPSVCPPVQKVRVHACAPPCLRVHRAACLRVARCACSSAPWVSASVCAQAARLGLHACDCAGI